MAQGKKKVVRAAALPEAEAAKVQAEQVANWRPTPEAKKQATNLRIIAWVSWLVAIGAEAFGIFWLLRQTPFTTGHSVALIGLLVVICGLAVTGSLTWKKANHLDPASEKDTVRYFVQNQLGAFMTLLAFVPLIVMILVSKNLDGKQKAIAGGVAVVLALVGVYFGIDFNPASREQVVAGTSEVAQLTGKDEVFWTKSGEVYHLCEQASAVNQESKDNTIYSGTVAQAVAAGKTRLTKQVDAELKQCGFPARSAVPSAAATGAVSAAPTKATSVASPTK